jgi:hypothetical protein
MELQQRVYNDMNGKEEVVDVKSIVYYSRIFASSFLNEDRCQKMDMRIRAA